jgi:hypothetical protein
MKEIHRVVAAVIVATALAACSADPIGPSGRPSLLMVDGTEAPLVQSTDAVASTCVLSADSGDALVSESSTYTVAYGCSCTTAPEGGDGQLSASSTYTVAYDELTSGCDAPPTDTTSVPPPPTDTTSVSPPLTDTTSVPPPPLADPELELSSS